MYGHVSIFFIHKQILHLTFYITPFNSNMSLTFPEIYIYFFFTLVCYFWDLHCH